ncbi:MAG TPA: hypothetical protein VHC20_05030 [Candidatus Paceibacterota bacterium]|nr:hypothetical protein [Candidatus Paceibacterota bacterium]
MNHIGFRGSTKFAAVLLLAVGASISLSPAIAKQSRATITSANPTPVTGSNHLSVLGPSKKDAAPALSITTVETLGLATAPPFDEYMPASFVRTVVHEGDDRGQLLGVHLCMLLRKLHELAVADSAEGERTQSSGMSFLRDALVPFALWICALALDELADFSVGECLHPLDQNGHG